MKAKFIKESFGENYTVEQGKHFTKSWTFRNDGAEAWPADTRLVYTNGDVFGAKEKAIGKIVRPGEYCDIVLEFVAP